MKLASVNNLKSVVFDVFIVTQLTQAIKPFSMLQFTPHQQCISETTKLFEAKQYIISHMNDSGSYDSLVHGFFR